MLVSVVVLVAEATANTIGSAGSFDLLNLAGSFGTVAADAVPPDLVAPEALFFPFFSLIPVCRETLALLPVDTAAVASPVQVFRAEAALTAVLGAPTRFFQLSALQLRAVAANARLINFTTYAAIVVMLPSFPLR